MNRIVAKILLFVFASSVLVWGQQSRLDALGGLSYSIVDIDSQIDPYLLGGNPAWLINSQVNQRLEIDPVFKNSNGDYHRYYESGDVNYFDAGFMGIKPLGSSGTFRGYAAYHYEMQKDRNRILTLNPYSGDGFFFTDTISGDYRYSGPTFEFMHSIEVLDNFFVGAAINYKILDGLKKVYTFAETLYRNVSGNIGIAYRFSDAFVLGVNYKIFDSQERITADDVNNTTIQTFLYRGETYKIELRGSSQDYKLRKFGQQFATQIRIVPSEKFVVGLNVQYFLHNSSSLFPINSIQDIEDGYASYGETSAELQARWLQNDLFTFGFTVGYNENDSWTKNSKYDLTTWKFNIKDIFPGIGLTFHNRSNDFLIGAEYELHSISADSSKFIDNKYNDISALNHIGRVGIETSFSKLFVLRIGYNYIFKEYDFIYGGENVSTHFVTLGARIRISESFDIEPRFEYSTTNLSENDLYRNNYGIYTTLRFYKF